MIDIYKRYQVGLTLKDIYPDRKNGLCACGCNRKLIGRQRRWASEKCQDIAVLNFFIIKGDSSIIRYKLHQEENGFCRSCGVFSENWEADHIIPVFLGGSACGLENIQTLCKDCHKVKTHNDGQIEAISRHASCIFDLRMNTDFGAISCVFPKQSIEQEKFVLAV